MLTVVEQSIYNTINEMDAARVAKNPEYADLCQTGFARDFAEMVNNNVPADKQVVYDEYIKMLNHIVDRINYTDNSYHYVHENEILFAIDDNRFLQFVSF